MNRFLQKILPARSTPLLALLTDFGSSDHYAGTMKAVISSVNPAAHVIDISHSVTPQGISEAAYLLWASYRFFPEETIFVIVVDPGVGSDRDILLLRMASRWFLLPDNGVADFVLGDHPVDQTLRVRQRESRYVLSKVSSTFHARDIFAPVASYLALGVSPRELGDPCPAPSRKNFFCMKPGKTASVLHVDHFGNIITDVRGEDAQPATVSLKGRKLGRWIKSYAEAPDRVPCLICGSSGLIEIITKNGNAARMLKVKSGAPLRVSWT